jgi:hypothetical protein
VTMEQRRLGSTGVWVSELCPGTMMFSEWGTNDAIESPVLVWVADHRRPYKYSDREGDPHSPWRFGTGGKAVAVTL